MMAKVINPLLSSEAKGRIGKLIVFYGDRKARGWSTQIDPQTAPQLQSRAVVGEVMSMIQTCAGLDRAWLRANFSKAWHTKATAWLSRNGLANAQAVHDLWTALDDGQRAAWESIIP